ncbi:MAG: nucleoside triphosphate pyrophosphohydrolase [Alphaproteobacteria bacterium]
MATNIERLLTIMAQLRDPDTGCPWDVKQSFATIAPYTIEEAYEVADAIAREDHADLKGELGDLLLQVVFHARMAEEAGLFDFDAVAGAIADKMVSRHPHVFGAEDKRDAAAQTRSWEAQKAEERAARARAAGGPPASVLADVALSLPALMRAEKLQKRAARVGFDWTEPEPVFGKILEEVAELRTEFEAGGDRDRLEDELGDVLFTVANLARFLKVDPEVALRRTNDKFARRFRAIEAGLTAEGLDFADVDLEEMERRWVAAKLAERA